MPLIFLGRGVSAQRWFEPVSIASIFATIEQSFGEQPSPFVVRGLWPTVSKASKPDPLPVFSEGSHHVAVGTGGTWSIRGKQQLNDESFWSIPNPNTGGVVSRIDEDSVDIGAREADVDIDALIASYMRQREEIDKSVLEHSQKANKTFTDEKAYRQLKTLGYLSGQK